MLGTVQAHSMTPLFGRCVLWQACNNIIVDPARQLMLTAGKLNLMAGPSHHITCTQHARSHFGSHAVCLQAACPRPAMGADH